MLHAVRGKKRAAPISDDESEFELSRSDSQISDAESAEYSAYELGRIKPTVRTRRNPLGQARPGTIQPQVQASINFPVKKKLSRSTYSSNYPLASTPTDPPVGIKTKSRTEASSNHTESSNHNEAPTPITSTTDVPSITRKSTTPSKPGDLSCVDKRVQEKQNAANHLFESAGVSPDLQAQLTDLQRYKIGLDLSHRTKALKSQLETLTSHAQAFEKKVLKQTDKIESLESDVRTLSAEIQRCADRDSRRTKDTLIAIDDYRVQYERLRSQVGIIVSSASRASGQDGPSHRLTLDAVDRDLEVLECNMLDFKESLRVR